MFDNEAVAPDGRRRSRPRAWADPADRFADWRVSDASRTYPETAAELQGSPETSNVDDQLLAELPARISEVLVAAKGASEEIISRAKERAALLEHESHQKLQETAEQAERDVNQYLQRARQKGQELVDEARRASERMLAEARAERDGMFADLTSRRAMLEKELQSREAELARLREACAALSAMVDDVLNRFGGRSSHSGSGPEDFEVLATRRRTFTNTSARPGTDESR